MYERGLRSGPVSRDDIEDPARGSPKVTRKGLLVRAKDFAQESVELGNPLRCVQDLRELMDESTDPLQIDMVAVQRK